MHSWGPMRSWPSYRPRPRREIGDDEALDRIRALMSAREWSADTLEEIASVVRKTGRVVRDVD